MRPENRARRQHNAIALRLFGQSDRILHVWKSCPQKHPVRGFDKQFHSDLFQPTRDVKARCLQPFM